MRALVEPFSKKLELVLKALSLSRSQLAADLGVDKSIVGRWVSGAVQPSAHNLSLLTALVARRAPGFATLDWDRGLESLAEVLGADPSVVQSSAPLRTMLDFPAALMAQIHATTAQRGEAYEGFYRSTRPYVLAPGKLVHDHCMIRRDPNGLLRFSIGTAGTLVVGWNLPLGNQLFSIGADVTSGALLFGIFHGVGTSRVDVVDGLCLTTALDAGRTPTAHAIIFERVGDLTGNAVQDDATFATLAALDPLAPEGSVSEAVRDHLLSNFGPTQAAHGGDMFLRMPITRSMARGPEYRATAAAPKDPTEA